MKIRTEFKPSQRIVVFCAVLLALLGDLLGYPVQALSTTVPGILLKTALLASGVRLLVGGLLVYWALRQARTHYQIDSTNIISTTGIIFGLSKCVALQQIKHVNIDRSIGQELLGLADLEIICSDAPQPDLVLRDLPLTQAQDLYSWIRALSGKSK